MKQDRCQRGSVRRCGYSVGRSAGSLSVAAHLPGDVDILCVGAIPGDGRRQAEEQHFKQIGISFSPNLMKHPAKVRTQKKTMAPKRFPKAPDLPKPWETL